MSQAFHDHFSAVANRYADFRPHYPAELFDYLTTLVPQSATVWDCACGNGQATHDLAARFAKVSATDASPEQIASATLNPKVAFRVALAEQSGVPEEVANIEPIAAIFLVVMLGGMLLLAARGRHASNLIVRVLQFVFPWWKERVARITNSFVDGLAVLYHGSSIVMVLALSLVIWLMTTLNFWLIGNALGLEIPLYGYVMIVAVTNMASFIPSLPGRFGTLELFSVFVLGLFGVDKNTAVLFPILLRVAQLGPILLGYVFLNREGVKILDVTRSSERQTDERRMPSDDARRTTSDERPKPAADSPNV